MRVIAAPLLVIGLALAGCASHSPEPRATETRERRPEGERAPTAAQSDESVRREREARRAAAQEKAIRRAYQKGVDDTLEDLRGRLRAREGFTYQPPVIDYVQMPGRAVNGAVYPPHKVPVIYRPGRWVERNGAQYPPERGMPLTGGGNYGPPSGTPTRSRSGEREQLCCQGGASQGAALGSPGAE